MQLFTGIHGKGAFLNGKPIKGVSLGDYYQSSDSDTLFFANLSMILKQLHTHVSMAVSSQSELVKSLLATEVCFSVLSLSAQICN
jgi:fructose-1,6-bisphosphatase/inositol monophosphatase family enzyme